MKNAFLAVGLIFPLLSWVTYPITIFQWVVKKKRVSPIAVPIVGPILLTVWVILECYPRWTIALVWILDPGTIMFLYSVIVNDCFGIFKRNKS